MKFTTFLISLVILCQSVIGYAQTISVEIDNIDTYATQYVNGDVHHNAYLDFDIDFGNIPLANIESFMFEVQFIHNSSSVIDFYLDGNEAVDVFQTCLGASVADIELIGNTSNSKTYRYSASYFGSDIPTINNQICPLLATVVKNVIITPIDIDDTIYDCDAMDIESTDINLNILNSNISLSGGLGSQFSTNNYSNTFDLPTCAHPQINLNEYTLHCEKYEDQYGNLMLDLFIRVNTPPISQNYIYLFGNIRMEFDGATFTNPFLNSNGAATANLTGSNSSTLSYNFNLISPYDAGTSLHLGSIGFGDIEYSTDCLEISFNTTNDFPSTLVLNASGTELVGVDYRPVLNCGDNAIESLVIDSFGGFGKGKLAATPIKASQIAKSNLIQIESGLQNFKTNEVVQLNVIDMQGKSIFNDSFLNTNEYYLEKIIHINNLTNGLYMITLTGNSNVEIVKLIIQ